MRRLGRETWNGKPVEEFRPEDGIINPVGISYSISFDWGLSGEKRAMADVFAQLVADPRCSELTSLVIGPWAEWVGGGNAGGDDIDSLIGLLVGASEQLPSLTSLFIGDIESEQCEISWIQQGDLSPLFGAFPQLESLGIRGGEGLTIGSPSHHNLKKLIIESGGLPVSVVQEVAAADFPALEHLELWLGSSGYGWDGTIDDLAPFLNGEKWPDLKYLGLRNSEIADEIAGHLATAPVLNRIKTLDLSMGNLTDAGVEALLHNRDALSRLEALDLHHHFLSEGMIDRLQELPISVDASDPQEADEYDGEAYRYIAVSE
jgi:hypothetical protein